MNGLLKTRMAALKSELHDLDYEIRLSEDRIETYKKHIKSLGDNRRKKIDDFNESVDKAQTNISNVQEECNTLMSKVGELQNESSDSETIKDKLTKTLELQKQLDLAKTRGAKEIKFYEDNDECPTCHRDMEDHFKQEKISTTSKKVSQIEKGIGEIADNITSINKRIEEIQQIQSKVDTLNRQVAQKQNEISASNQYIIKINQEIEKLRTDNVTDDSTKLNTEQKSLKQHNQTKESLIDKRSYYDVAGYLLQDSGIKTKIITI
jgi:DNA repair exonuclease SbcCD ATPase subunit